MVLNGTETEKANAEDAHAAEMQKQANDKIAAELAKKPEVPAELIRPAAEVNNPNDAAALEEALKALNNTAA